MVNKNKDGGIINPKVLAFERKLDTSDGVFSSGLWEYRENGESWTPIPVWEKAVRGTTSHRHKTDGKDPAKLDTKKEDANLQRIDVATLPDNIDTLRVKFTLKVLGGVGIPCACNEPEYRQKLLRLVDGYVEEHNGFRHLARRYAQNLANGRFLWRNHLGAEQIEVQVSQVKSGKRENKWLFNSRHYNIKDLFDTDDDADIESLKEVIAEGFAEKDNYILLEVVAYARVGEGQEVYPSQELILNEKNEKGRKSKTLYTLGEGAAAMHSQKIGNALRTIDTWYSDPKNYNIGPIAIEPFGSVTTLGRAFRSGKKSLYKILDDWMLNDKKPDTNQQHYVMANLIRGGVFSDGDKKKDKKDKE